MTCTATAIDADVDDGTDSLTYSFEWIVDGNVWSGATTATTGSSTIDASDLVAGQEWICKVKVMDEDGLSEGPVPSEQAMVASGCVMTDCDSSLDLGGGVGIDFVLIGKETDAPLEDPLGRYTLTKDFYMMTTEVTQGMFLELMSYDPLSLDSSHGVGDEHPVYNVNWHMAADFANMTTQFHNIAHGTSLQECYSCTNSNTTNAECSEAMNPYVCDGYVLPTEAEWELAARSGTAAEFWTPNGGGNFSADTCGNSVNNTNITIEDGSTNPPPLSDYAWWCGNRDDTEYPDTTKPVGLKLPNGYGLHDMHGNLFEWISDWEGCSYPEASIDPYCGNTGSYRILRGGAWTYFPIVLQASTRDFNYPSSRYFISGIRLVRHP